MIDDEGGADEVSSRDSSDIQSDSNKMGGLYNKLKAALGPRDTPSDKISNSEGATFQ